MEHLKFVCSLKIICLLIGSILFTACGEAGKNIDPNAGTSKVVADNNLCKVDGYNIIAMDSNLKKIKKETYYHQNVLSGAAKDLKNIIQAPKLSDSYDGLFFACDAQRRALQIECDGKITIVDGEKVEILNYPQLLEMSPIYVKTAMLCGQLNLNPNDALFIVAERTLFQDVSISLKESSVFSLSSQVIEGAFSNLKSVQQEPGSSISIHAISINH